MTYTSKTNFVPKTMESADAHLGIRNVVELGEAKTRTSQQPSRGDVRKLAPCMLQCRYQ